MSKRLSKSEHDSVVIDVTTDFGHLSEDEFEALYVQLDISHKDEVDAAVREFADSAVGSDLWNSDN